MSRLTQITEFARRHRASIVEEAERDGLSGYTNMYPYRGFWFLPLVIGGGLGWLLAPISRSFSIIIMFCGLGIFALGLCHDMTVYLYFHARASARAHLYPPAPFFPRGAQPRNWPETIRSAPDGKE